MTLSGQMMSQPLLVSSIIAHAARHSATTEIVSRRSEGDIHRYNYRECERRARQLANCLAALGVVQGDRVGTLAWNGHRHLEIYYAASGMGAVCHTLNPRLFEDQLVYIINHADDAVLFFDLDLALLIDKLVARCPGVRAWICMTDLQNVPTSSSTSFMCYEELMDTAEDSFEWPELDENSASSLCYTSGTTGNPKGALFSHRSTVLHSYGSALPDAIGCTSSDVLMPIVPMFHANAWGLPYLGPLVGAKMVLPGPALDSQSLHELMEQEQVSMAAGVPTIWHALIDYVRSKDLAFNSLDRTIIGGAAVPPAMIADLDGLGVTVVHAWGMTELSPIGTICRLLPKHRSYSNSEALTIRSKQGRAIYGIDMKIVGEDGKELPWDGEAFGDLMVRGYWVVDSYYDDDQDAVINGWFATGDVATIDADGYMHITDRSKDVIKSGGEWISSITLENVAASHPAVQMAACIACPHPKWGERPLLIVVPRPDMDLTRDEILEMYQSTVAKWWVPDDVVFVQEIPLTATGKLQKLALREQFKNYVFPE